MYGSLSVPEFRRYVVAHALEQARMGVTELHFGETNGKILFDDWSLGLKGNSGFIQWILQKYPNHGESFWHRRFGPLGTQLSKTGVLTRADFLSLKGSFLNNFRQEWGTNLWNGTNDQGEQAFLSAVYRKNLESFLAEMKTALVTYGFQHVKVDIWGFAPWMVSLQNRPDAFISSPPDERWGFNWNKDANFPIQSQTARIRDEMSRTIQSVSPTPVIFRFDHPTPFQSHFVRLPDQRQAFLTKYFADLTASLGANFVFRGYTHSNETMGPVARAYISSECKARNLNSFCPRLGRSRSF
jgi:hypothetical protein